MGVCGIGTVEHRNFNSVKLPAPIERHNRDLSTPLDGYIQWLDLQFHDENQSTIKKPGELDSNLKHPPSLDNKELRNRVSGSLFGLALGDALGAHVEFRPHQYLVEHPVTDLVGGGTWGLKKGQFTDDTSMALCLASSLVATHGFSPYDQLVRYKWWYRHGYMSSTGQCFDIGSSTKKSLHTFEERQQDFANQHKIPHEEIDSISDQLILEKKFNIYCSDAEAAGNGALMRLCPVPLFFHRSPQKAVEYSGISAQITHGDQRAYDACRFYGALIVAALNGKTKDELLDPNFYKNHKDWFSNKPLHKDIQTIIEGSYKKKLKGYDDGIRGKGYVVCTLEAALWAFCFDDDSFEKGVLAAVNLGDDTDTTAAIYGQLAGAYYGYEKLPQKWVQQIYAKKFIMFLSEWIVYEGQRSFQKSRITSKVTLESRSPRVSSISSIQMETNEQPKAKSLS